MVIGATFSCNCLSHAETWILSNTVQDMFLYIRYPDGYLSSPVDSKRQMFQSKSMISGSRGFMLWMA
jgi:hypothetical protein